MTDKKPQLNIHQRISAVMADVAYVQKGNKKVNGQYTFVSHDDVTAAIRPALINHGITVVPTVTEHNQIWTQYEEGGHTKFRGMTEVDITVDFINIDSPEDKVSVALFGYGIDPQDKGPGKAFSYAKKYAFLQLFCLETGDDPERDNVDHKPDEKPWTGPIKKTALKATLRQFARDVHSQTNIDELEALPKNDDYALALEQANIDLPDHAQSCRDEYKKRMDQLKLEAEFKQPE